MIKKIIQSQFSKYVFVGGIATIVDWGVFYLLSEELHFYYQLALVVSFVFGSLTNFLLNKVITFQCKSKKIVGQVGVHLAISFVSLLMSVGLMFVMVEIVLVDKMISRVFVTFIMLFVNFFMHKYLTFNKRFFS